MSEEALLVVAVALAYLCGALPFGVWIARWRGVEIQKEGSGNTGATNVARTLGRGEGLVVLCLDVSKGAGPMFAVHHLVGDELVLVLAGLATVLGHCHSPWLRFRGGKGVATSLGVLAAVDGAAAGTALLAFALGFAFSRRVSVGSLLAVWLVAAMALASVFVHIPASLAVGLAVVVTLEHGQNIRRLIGGREPRFGG